MKQCAVNDFALKQTAAKKKNRNDSRSNETERERKGTIYEQQNCRNELERMKKGSGEHTTSNK